MTTWYDFYKERINNTYFTHIKEKYAPFISEIKKSIKSGMVIFEEGAGIGSISKILFNDINNTCTFMASDNNYGMIKLMANNFEDSDIAIKHHDCLVKSDKWYDIIHSHGVLEHFSNKEIRKIVNNQLLKCNTLIHYVPSSKYKEPSFGDERLMSKDEWKSIANPDKIIEFNNGYDLILKWE